MYVAPDLRDPVLVPGDDVPNVEDGAAQPLLQAAPVAFAETTEGVVTPEVTLLPPEQQEEPPNTADHGGGVLDDVLGSLNERPLEDGAARIPEIVPQLLAQSSSSNTLSALFFCLADLTRSLDFGEISITIPIQLWRINFKAREVNSPRIALPTNVEQLTPIVELTPHQEFEMNVLVSLPLLKKESRHNCIPGRSLYFLVLEEETEKWRKVEGGDFSDQRAMLKMKHFCQLVAVEGPCDEYTITCEAWVHREPLVTDEYKVMLLVYVSKCQRCGELLEKRKAQYYEDKYVPCTDGKEVLEVDEMPTGDHIELHLKPAIERVKGIAISPRQYPFKGTLLRKKFVLPLESQGGIRYSLETAQEKDMGTVVFSLPREHHAEARPALFVHGPSTADDLVTLPQEWSAVERALPGSERLPVGPSTNILKELEEKFDKYKLLIVSAHREEDQIRFHENGNGRGSSIGNDALEELIRKRWGQKKANPECIVFATCGGGKLPERLVGAGVLFTSYWENMLGKSNTIEGVPDILASHFTGLFVQALSEQLQEDHRGVSLYARAFKHAKEELVSTINGSGEFERFRAWTGMCHSHPSDPLASESIRGAGRLLSARASSTLSTWSCTTCSPLSEGTFSTSRPSSSSPLRRTASSSNSGG